MKNYGLADQFISPWAVGTTGREVMDITLGLIGFGEAGSTFAVTAAWSGKSRGWDILPQRCAAMADAGVIAAVEAASEAEIALRAAGFARTRIVGADVGRASAIKMIRSVMVKGIEALTDEMMAAAAAAEVADEVLASLDASEAARPWAQRAAYNLERMATHGARRAAEMEESAKTLQSLGVEPLLTRATVQRQRAAAMKKDQAA